MQAQAMMGRKELLEAIAEVVHDVLGRDGIVEIGTDLVADLGLDSLDRLTLVVELESRFDVCLVEADDEPDADLVSVADLMARIEACLADKETRRV